MFFVSPHIVLVTMGPTTDLTNFRWLTFYFNFTKYIYFFRILYSFSYYHLQKDKELLQKDRELDQERTKTELEKAKVREEKLKYESLEKDVKILVTLQPSTFMCWEMEKRLYQMQNNIVTTEKITRKSVQSTRGLLSGNRLE